MSKPKDTSSGHTPYFQSVTVGWSAGRTPISRKHTNRQPAVAIILDSPRWAQLQGETYSHLYTVTIYISGRPIADEVRPQIETSSSFVSISKALELRLPTHLSTDREEYP